MVTERVCRHRRLTSALGQMLTTAAARLVGDEPICRLSASWAMAIPAYYGGGKSRPLGSLIQRTVCSSGE